MNLMLMSMMNRNVVGFAGIIGDRMGTVGDWTGSEEDGKRNLGDGMGWGRGLVAPESVNYCL